MWKRLYVVAWGFWFVCMLGLYLRAIVEAAVDTNGFWQPNYVLIAAVALVPGLPLMISWVRAGGPSERKVPAVLYGLGACGMVGLLLIPALTQEARDPRRHIPVPEPQLPLRDPGPQPGDRIDLSGIKISGRQLSGASWELGTHRRRVVLLDFWASWCGPCVRSIDTTRALASKLADEREFEFVMLSVDHDEAAARKAIEWNKAAGTQVLGAGDAFHKLGGKSIPLTILVVDGTARVVSVESPGLESEIRELLKRPRG